MQRISLDYHAFQVQTAQQLFEGGLLTGCMHVVGLLGQGDSKEPGVHRHLAHKRWWSSSVSMA